MCQTIESALTHANLNTGLIRHDRSSLLDFFASLQPPERHKWQRRVHRLASHGILHKELAPFLWPSGDSELGKCYWRWAKAQNEGELWPRPVAAAAEDYDRIISLLAGCNVVHELNDNEYLAPELVNKRQQKRLDARAFTRSHLGVEAHLTLPILPDGFLTRLLVKLRQHYSHMDFSASGAALYGRGRKVQLFAGHTSVKSNKDAVCASRKVSRLTCFTSTIQEAFRVQKYLEELHRFFPGTYSLHKSTPINGLKLVRRDSALLEPIQVRFVYCTGVGIDHMRLLAVATECRRHVKRRAFACAEAAAQTTGYITFSAFQTLSKHLKSEGTWQDMFRNLDKDKDGKISLGEFEKFLEEFDKCHLLAKSVTEEEFRNAAQVTVPHLSPSDVDRLRGLLRSDGGQVTIDEKIECQTLSGGTYATCESIKQAILEIDAEGKGPNDALSVVTDDGEWTGESLGLYAGRLRVVLVCMDADMSYPSVLVRANKLVEEACDIWVHGSKHGILDELTSGAPAPGLKWVDIGSEYPRTGIEIKNEKLAAMLQTGKRELVQDDLDSVQADISSYNVFIKVGDIFLRPAAMQDDEGNFYDICALEDWLNHNSTSPNILGLDDQDLHQSISGHLKRTEEIISEVQALGLRWKETGSAAPMEGTEIHNGILADALRKKLEFTRTEIAHFALAGLSPSSYIKSGDSYFQPAFKTDLDESIAAEVALMLSSLSSVKLLHYLNLHKAILKMLRDKASFKHAGILNLGTLAEVATILRRMSARIVAKLSTWQDVGPLEPTAGRQIFNEPLAAALEPRALGLIWEKVPRTNLPLEPTKEIRNKALAAALLEKVCLTRHELVTFKVPELSYDNYVNVDGKYYRPAKICFTKSEWQAFDLHYQSSQSFIRAGDRFFRPDTALLEQKCDRIVVDLARRVNILYNNCTHQKGLSQLQVVRDLERGLLELALPLQQFRAAAKAGLAMIALICPGYRIEDYSCWWPDNMPELSKHALFFDCRSMFDEHGNVADKWRETLKPGLLVQIYKFLEEWRGQTPDPRAFAAAADRIPCVRCSEEPLQSPHVFSRSACEEKLRMARKQIAAAARIAEGHEVRGEEWAQSMLHGRCSHGHMMPYEEILSRNVIQEAVPCPSCVTHGEVPPFCFSRQECLLYFSEESLQDARSGSMLCPCCERAGRLSNVRVMDIIVAEVFFSYNWGCNNSTQMMVRPMRLRIEQKADVICWLDVGGGMGAGQSQFAEMEEGIRKCTVVLIFISDAYCGSDNCVREFLHATRHSKYLIPVLVPNCGPTRTGPSGWTGPGPGERDWWQHATKCSSCRDPDTGKPFSWSALGQFEPIDLRVEGDEANHAAQKRVSEACELEIVKRIQSRFHRGEHIDHTARMYSYWHKYALLDCLTASLDEPDRMLAEVAALFERLDTNKNGEINKAELLVGFPKLDDKTADMLIADADADGSGGVSLSELWDVVESVRQGARRPPAGFNAQEQSKDGGGEDGAAGSPLKEARRGKESSDDIGDNSGAGCFGAVNEGAQPSAVAHEGSAKLQIKSLFQRRCEALERAVCTCAR